MTDPDQNATKPPPGYTAEELERDNPYNAWMHDMSLETSEADARPYNAALDLANMVSIGMRLNPDAIPDPDPYQRASARLESLRNDPLLLAQIDAARMSPNPKLTLKVEDGVVMGVGIDMLRESDKVYPSRPINAAVPHSAKVDYFLVHKLAHDHRLDYNTLARVIRDYLAEAHHDH